MHGRSARCLLAVVVWMLAPRFSLGQSDRANFIPQTPDPAPRFAIPTARGTQAPGHVLPAGAFAQISQAAGIIFAGRVLAVSHHPASQGESVGTIEIAFHVDRAIRGTIPGERLTISQWSGLWSGGQRYRVGERVLLLLYPRSRLGLTSSVGGPMGRFQTDAQGHVLFSDYQFKAFRLDPVLGGKSRVSFGDFALAVRRSGEEK